MPSSTTDLRNQPHAQHLGVTVSDVIAGRQISHTTRAHNIEVEVSEHYQLTSTSVPLPTAAYAKLLMMTLIPRGGFITRTQEPTRSKDSIGTSTKLHVH